MISEVNRALIDVDVAQMVLGVNRVDVALGILGRMELSEAQLGELRGLLARYEQPEKVSDAERAELLPVTRDTNVGRAIESVQPGRRRLWIVAGGQSGVDRAALDSAAELALPSRGWCPTARWAEDGTIAAKYPMQECDSPDPAARTELNTFDSDATLVLTRGNPTDGTPLTAERARAHGKPTLVITLGQQPDVEGFWKWIDENNVRVLNIGGPRESFAPGEVYRQAREILDALLDPTTLSRHPVSRVSTP